MEKSYKYITVFYIILFVAAALGAGLGALYYVNKFAQGDDIINYLDGFAKTMQKGVDGGSIALRSIKNSLVIIGIFAICSFFRLGMIPVIALAARQGFVIGFANAVFIGSYGNQGLLIALSRLPENSLYFAAVLITGAAVCAAALLRPEKNKSFLKIFLVFLFFSVSTFCASAFVEGYLTTTFMKMLL